MSATFDAHSPDQDLRARNRETVTAFIAETDGERRRNRHRLFAEDAVAGLATSDTGDAMMVVGRENIGKLAAWSLTSLPDWSWTNVDIYDTQDPNVFWVECDGSGHLNFPAYGERWYENHFIQFFRLRDGLIIEQREFMNPVRQMKALGIVVPTVDRGSGVPSDYSKAAD